MLLDALYAKGPVFSLCDRYGWKYILVFEEGNIPAPWREYEALRDLRLENRRTVVRQTFAWVSDPPYTDAEERSFRLGVLECRE